MTPVLLWREQWCQGPQFKQCPKSSKPNRSVTHVRHRSNSGWFYFPFLGEGVCHCIVLSILELCVDQPGWSWTQRSNCFCLLSLETKGPHHHSQLLGGVFFKILHDVMVSVNFKIWSVWKTTNTAQHSVFILLPDCQWDAIRYLKLLLPWLPQHSRQCPGAVNQINLFPFRLLLSG